LIYDGNIWVVGIRVPCKYVALYEGEYTADNIPPYVYKGYAAELTECMRYYREDPVLELNLTGAVGYKQINTPFYNPPMVRTPNYEIKNYSGALGDLVDSSLIDNGWGGNNKRINLAYTATGTVSQCSFTLVSIAEL